MNTKDVIEFFKTGIVITLFLVAGGIRMEYPDAWGLTFSILHVLLGVVLFSMWFEHKEEVRS